MKKIITIILICLMNFLGFGQTYPINEPFNSVAAWTCTNGSGLQTYGAGLNYLTTNIGTTPYPNSSTITMTSPVYSFTNCVGVLSLSFPISGIIENASDYMYFEYSTNGGSSWTTAVAHTGNRNNLYNYTLSNNINRFRFRLVTNNSINSYGPWWNTSVYYYDIDYFNINCTSALPIELLYFNGDKQACNQNLLSWSTATESNNDYFQIERSINGIDFNIIGKIKGAGTSLEIKKYSFSDINPESTINYYRLTQIDYDGKQTQSHIIDIDNFCIKNLEIVKIVNILGQEVNEDFEGSRFIFYNDGSVIRK